MKSVVIIVTFIIFLFVPFDAYATLYNNEQIGFSIEYDTGWIFDDFTLSENKGEEIVYLYNFDDDFLPKADIAKLWINEVTDISDVLYAEVVVRNIDELLSKNKILYTEELFELQTKECLIIHLFNQGVTCNNISLLDQKKLMVNGNDAYQIKYSWIEKYDFCDYSIDIRNPLCYEKTFDNISIVTDVIIDDKVWRFNSFVRYDKVDSLETEINKIIRSLKLFEIKNDDSKIPQWIKNNAGWWADGAIDDASFLNGIQYLIDNLIFSIPDQKGSKILSVDTSNVFLPEYSRGTSQVTLSGILENHKPGYEIVLEVIRPDGETDKLKARVFDGDYELIYTLMSDSPVGKYTVTGEYLIGDFQIDPISFNVQHPGNGISTLVPTWVKSSAGWWASDVTSDDEFISTMQFLVSNGIIVLDKQEVVENSLSSDLDSELVIYQSKVLTKNERFTVLVIQATSNEVCTSKEKQNTKEYGQIAEYMLKKNLRDKLPEIIAVCMQLGDIRESTYPLVLKELEVNRPDLLMFIGNIKANFESYYDYGAYGWWACMPVYDSKFTSSSCGINIIVVCECDTRYENYHEGAIWTLSHEIAHYMLFEQNHSGKVYGDNVHWVEYLYQTCNENNSEDKECLKLYETFSGNTGDYDIIDIQYLKSDWREIQNEISHEILSSEGYQEK